MTGSNFSIAIGGLGAIGMDVARRLDQGIDGLSLVAVSARDCKMATKRVSNFLKPPPVVSHGSLADLAEIIVECAPADAFPLVAEPAIRAGRILIPLSCGALLSRPDLVELTQETGAKILVPTGALLGLDAVRAAAEGKIYSIRMITRKPPGGLKGAPHCLDNSKGLLAQ